MSWPLVERGIRVLMLDAGSQPIPWPTDRPSLNKIRHADDDAWRFLLKPDLSGLRDVGDVSPKLRFLTDDAESETFHAINRIEGNGIDTVGLLSLGGLSNVWGAVSPVFDDQDFEDWPIKSSDMASAYAQVAARIGISGDAADAPVNGGGIPLQPALPLTPTAETVLMAAQRQGTSPGFRLARSQNAVLSQNLDHRRACDLDGGCMWGCPHGAIYNSANELSALGACDHFQLATGRAVRRVRPANGGHAVETIDMVNGSAETYEAPTVVLAAGTIASTRIALERLERYEEPISFFTTPAVGAAFVCPSRLGSPLPERCFGFAQISYRVDLEDDGQYAYGVLYDAATLSAVDMVRHMPFSKVGSAALFRSLQSALMVTLLYFPGNFSRNIVQLEKDKNGARLRVTGGYIGDIRSLTRRTLRRAATGFRRVGLFMLPGSAKLYPPGAESHFGGTLAMGKLATMDGELVGVDNLFAVDGSVFSSLPAKHPTLTIMANAHRIGERIATRIAA